MQYQHHQLYNRYLVTVAEEEVVVEGVLVLVVINWLIMCIYLWYGIQVFI